MNGELTFDVQPLESRRLLSAATGGLGTDPTIVADRAALKTASHTLQVDLHSGRKTIRTDAQALQAELKKLAADKGQQTINDAVKPLKDKLRTDTRAKNKEIRAALAAVATTRRNDLKIVRADTIALRTARRGTDQSAIDAAQKKLDADRAKLTADLKPLTDAVQAVKDKWRPIITADADAITKKLESLDSALTPLFDKVKSDADALTAKITADQTAVTDAATKLKTDVLAYLQAHPPTTGTTATA